MTFEGSDRHGGVLEPVLGAVGSLIAEELKGDLAAARRAADEGLAEAEAAADPSALAHARLAVGLVAVIQGDLGRGERCLNAALTELSGAAAQLAHAMSRLARAAREAELPTGAGLPVVVLPGPRAPPPKDPGPLDATAELVRSILILLPGIRWELETRARKAGDDAGAALEDHLNTLLPSELEVPPGWRAYAELVAADLCRRAGQLERGRERLAAALEQYESVGDKVGAGSCHLADGDWRAAPFSTPLAWDFALDMNASGGGDLPWWVEAREQAPGADLPAADAAYRRARDCFAATQAPRAMAAVELRQGYLALRAGDRAAARVHAEQARRDFEGAGDLRGTWLAAAHAVLARVAESGWPLGEDEEETAAAIGRWGAADGSYCWALGLGLLFSRAARHWELREGDSERALGGHRLAQTLFEGLGADLYAEHSLVDRATQHRRIGDWGTASLLFAEAVEWGERVTPQASPDEQLEALLRRWNVARDQFMVSLDARDTEGLKALRPVFEELPARMALLLPEAPRLTLKVAMVQEEAPEMLAQVSALLPMYLALEAERLGQRWNVPRYRDEAMAAAEGHGLLKAHVHLGLGEKDLARRAYLEYLEAGPAGPDLPPGIEELLDPVDLARLKEQQELAGLAQQLAMLVTLEAWTEAASRLGRLDALRQDWELAQEEPWLALDERGQVQEEHGELEQALDSYDRAIEALELRRERLTLDSLRVAQLKSRSATRPFLHAARAALRAAEAAPTETTTEALRHRAFGYAERGKARALLDLMTASRDRARGGRARHWREVDARLALSRSLLAQAANDQEADPAIVADLEQRVREDEAELARVEERLSDRPGWREAVAPSADVLPLTEVASRLQPGELMLQYQFLGGDLLGWAITNDGLVQVVHAPSDTARLVTSIAQFSEACYNGRPDWQELAAPLSEALLTPFAAQIEACSELVVVPFGPAHRLPIGALPLGGRSLLAGRSVSVLPSASAIAFLSDRAVPPGPLLGLGDPADMRYRPFGEPPRPEWGRVPWMGAAAALAAGLFPGSKLLLGADATEARLERHIGRFPLVLLGTHAELGDAPPRAYLVLARGGGLELFELLGLDFRRAELVVLAACETALGSVTGGDEVMGLSRGLLAAGASRAVLTLWKTDAHSAPLFLRALFRRLQAGEAPAPAVREAQLELAGLDEEEAREQYRELAEAAASAGHEVPDDVPSPSVGYDHPRHWAPWVLTGR